MFIYGEPKGRVSKQECAGASHVCESTHQKSRKRRVSSEGHKMFRKSRKSKIQTALKRSQTFIKHSEQHVYGKTGVKLVTVLWRYSHLTDINANGR